MVSDNDKEVIEVAREANKIAHRANCIATIALLITFGIVGYDIVFEKIWLPSEMRLEKNTDGEVLIFYNNTNQIGTVRNESILMILTNRLSEGLENIEFDAFAPEYTNIQNISSKTKPQEVEQNGEWSNNEFTGWKNTSIIKWQNIQEGTTCVQFILTWDARNNPSKIELTNSNFTMSANHKPVKIKQVSLTIDNTIYDDKLNSLCK